METSTLIRTRSGSYHPVNVPAHLSKPAPLRKPAHSANKKDAVTA